MVVGNGHFRWLADFAAERARFISLAAAMPSLDGLTRSELLEQFVSRDPSFQIIKL